MSDPFRRTAMNMLDLGEGKAAFDIEVDPDAKLPLPAFMNIPEGGLKASELAVLAGFHRRHGDYKTDIQTHLLLKAMQEIQGPVVVHPGVGRGLLKPMLMIDPGVTPAQINQYNLERAEGKVPTMIFADSIPAGSDVSVSYKTIGGAPPKHKAKKGGGKKKVRVSPLLKNLLKGLGK